MCEARLIDGLTDQEVRALFDRARDDDSAEIAKEARELSSGLDGDPAPEIRSASKVRLASLRTRLAAVQAIDFFGANGREGADGLLTGLERRIEELDAPAEQDAQPMPMRSIEELRNRTWVTRTGVHVDRIGSAWLIRRFIDPNARFKFVPTKGYTLGEAELRFDMFEAEFTHEGDRCTFEVLVERAGLQKDGALAAIAEIVHDIDLKDAKFGRPEAEGVRTLIAGICSGTPDDDERLARGGTLFEDLYRSFRRTAPGPKTKAS